MGSNAVKASIDTAISQVLGLNFDADSKTCILTLIKVLDNVLQKPEDPKVRSIRLSNKAFNTKVVQRGGLSILEACGFEKQQNAQLLQSQSEEHIILASEHEDQDTLLVARRMLAQTAIHQLKCRADDIPKFLPPKQRLATQISATSGDSFNVYEGHRFDAQSASVGTDLSAPSGWKSATDTKVAQLQAQQERLQSSLQSPSLPRDWIASLPGSSANAQVMSEGPQAPVSDSKLLQQHLAKQQQQRQAAENRGFTTKAMRDLERLKKAKVYSHTQLAIQFPDGCIVKGNFIPSETVQTVMDALVSEVFAPNISACPFELYQTPPRTQLDPKRTLENMQLVPAAKIYVSWKQKPQGDGIGWYLRKEWFQNESSSGPLLPTSKPVAYKAQPDQTQNAKPAAGKPTTKKKTKADKEANLLKRMMGKGGL